MRPRITQRVLPLLLTWLFLLGSASARETREPGFIPTYVPPETAAYKPLYELMKESKLLESTSQVLNELFVFPRDVNLVAAEIGTVNAFYCLRRSKSEPLAGVIVSHPWRFWWVGF